MSDVTQDPATERRGPPGLVIRAIRPQDAEAVAAMEGLPGYRWGTMRLPYPSPEAVQGWIERTPPGSASLVAIIDGQVVGCMTLERLQGRRAHVGRIGMGVHDAWTGQGIGSALLRAGLDLAERWLGLRRIELTVYPDNAPALALYQRHGFVPEGTHRAYALRDGQYVDALAMARLGGPELARGALGHG